MKREQKGQPARDTENPAKLVIFFGHIHSLAYITATATNNSFLRLTEFFSHKLSLIYKTEFNIKWNKEFSPDSDLIRHDESTETAVTSVSLQEFKTVNLAGASNGFGNGFRNTTTDTRKPREKGC